MSRRRGAWYGVDRDGLVGHFWPGFEGTVPRGARSAQRGAAMREAIELACVVRWLVVPGREPVRPDALAADRLLVVLRDLPTSGYREAGAANDAVTLLLAGFSPRVLREQGPHVVVTDDEVDVASLIALLRHDRVVHALALRDVAAIASRLGADDPRFVLRHDDERDERDEIYTLVREPAQPPLHESEIPEPERTALRALRAPASFAESSVIDVEGLVADRLEEGLLPTAPSAERGAAPVARMPFWATWLAFVVVMGVVRMILGALFGR